MANELIINTTLKGHRIILLKNGKIIEYHKEEARDTYHVGDIYLGVIKKTIPSLNAAFVDIGHKKNAFLHYLDLGKQFPSQQKFTTQVLQKKAVNYQVSKMHLNTTIEKEGSINQVLKNNQKVLVQIVKEAISTKGLRLSSALSIAGRYLILVPFDNEVNISKKITNITERERLNRLIHSIKPNNFGVIVRTVAKNKEVSALDQDLKYLLKKWETGVKTLSKTTPKKKIIKEVSRITSILRDLFNENFDQIIVDNNKTYEKVKNHIQDFVPQKEKIVQFYKGKTKIFEHFGLEKKIKTLFSKIVGIEGGGYLIIEQTEAMHIIDVNSGSNITGKTNQEDSALKVNLAAAKEIARQMRLRNMGGIIVVDFISLRNKNYKDEVYKTMKTYIKEDRAKIDILRLTKFGLMEITRKYERPIIYINTKELCPSCMGSGKIENSLIAEQIEKQLQDLASIKKEINITLILHPYLYAYFTKGLFSKQWRWYFHYKQWINIVQNQNIPITTYQFIDTKNEILATNPTLKPKARYENK